MTFTGGYQQVYGVYTDRVDTPRLRCTRIYAHKSISQHSAGLVVSGDLLTYTLNVTNLPAGHTAWCSAMCCQWTRFVSASGHSR
jgi:hypothetical protein